MKKRLFFSILLGLIMVLAGMSFTVSAASIYSKLQDNATVVKFDDKDWYLVDYDFKKGTVTLLTKDCIGESVYSSSGEYVDYSSSTVKDVVDAYYRDNISNDAKQAVSGDRMFLLPELDAIELIQINGEKAKCSQYWWVDANGGLHNTAAIVFWGGPKVETAGDYVLIKHGVRPAIMLEDKYVIFSPESNTFTVNMPLDSPVDPDPDDPEDPIPDPIPDQPEEQPVSISGATISGVKDKVYTGKALTQAITVKVGSKKLEAGTDYTESYKNNKNVGTAILTIEGKGNYTGTATARFKIIPKGTTISSLIAGKQSFVAKWKKQATQTDGYLIQYSTDKDFKKDVKSKAIKKVDTTRAIIKELAGNKTYYARICTYKLVNGKKYYSTWSKIKSVKTNK
jgi:hypothetical protein